MDKKEKILINFHSDGSVTGKDLQVLEKDEAIKNYIVKSKDEFFAAGKEPILYLRGGKDIVFKEARRVIRIASDAGVDQVIFRVYDVSDEKAEAPKVSDEKTERPEKVIKLPNPEDKKLLDRFTQLREQDLNIALPANEAEKLEKKVVLIQLNAQGQVFMGKEKLPLDKDPKKREMPLLQAELEKMMADGQALSVRINADTEAKQQRVIDILNTLGAVGISGVTFADEIER